MKRAALALAALAVATTALAQQATPSTDPRATTPQEQAAPPADSSTGMSQTDKQALMNKCMTQVQAANPNVPEKDVKAYCDKEISSIASPR